MKILSVVEYPTRKPDWASSILLFCSVHLHNLLCIIFENILYITFIWDIPR